MTRSSTNELFTPYKEPEREFLSSRRHFKSLSLESRSPDFNLFSDQEYSEEEEEEAMAETMEQYMSKTLTNYGSGVAWPKIKEKDKVPFQLRQLQSTTEQLGREIKKVNEKVYAAQVGCEQCKGPHYTKDCPLKEEGKTLEEAYYTQFGGPFQGGGYRATTPGVSVMLLSIYLNLGLGELAYTRKITLRVGEEKIIFKSVKLASSLIKKAYMLSLRERMELDLEARLMGETLVLNRSLDPFLEDYIELNDLNEPFELRRNQGDDLMPTIKEGEVIEEFRTRDEDLDTRIDDYPSYCDNDMKIHIDYAHNLKFSCMIGFEFTHVNFFPLLYVNVMSKSFINSIMNDKMVYKGCLEEYGCFIVMKNMGDLLGFFKGVLESRTCYIRYDEVGRTGLTRGALSVPELDN
ncbi:homeodomain-like protein [Tanacetum coccineum]